VKFLGVIPARYASTRLPGKPLADICGHPMIEWVYKRAAKSGLDEVLIATDSELIYEAASAFGGKCVMTRADHANGTSRIAEVCEKYPDFDVIVNVQGDEPLIEPAMIDLVISAFREEPELLMCTLRHKLTDPVEIQNPNAVKVVTDKNDRALYFSRSPVPYPRVADRVAYYKHIGIYGYKRTFVLEYAAMAPTPLEGAESLEQLRVLENGVPIKVVETTHRLIGVDTAEELARVREYIEKNHLAIS